MSFVAMAALPKHVYLPPLAECLEGGELLISWREALVALESHRGEDHEKLQAFLCDAQAMDMLAKPYDPYSSATQQTKSAYEQATAPINVSPGAGAPYDIREIKEDALWLSTEVKIDEISALRIIILEYQSRSRQLLLCDFAPEEIASLQEAAGDINTDTSGLVPQTAISNGSNLGDKVSSSEPQGKNRRARALSIYLSERRHILKCAQLLLYASAEEQYQDPDILEDAPIRCQVGNTLLARIRIEIGQHEFLNSCIHSLDGVFSALAKNNGSGWMQGDAVQELVDHEWFNNQLIQMILTMEIMLWIVESSKGNLGRHEVSPLCPAGVVLSWFKFLSTYGFLESFASTFPPAAPLIASMQTLVAAVSLSMINPWSSTSFFDERGSVSLNGQEIPYVVDLECVGELHTILVEAAKSQSLVASPAVLGWSIVLREARNTSVSRREARELRQSQKAIDGFEIDPPPREEDTNYEDEFNRPRAQRRSSISSEHSHETGIHDKIMEIIMDTDLEEDPIEYLGRSAIDGCNVFDVLTQLASSSLALTAVTQQQIRLTVLDCIRCTTSFMGYIPEIVTAILAALVGAERYWDLENKALPGGLSPVGAFCMDDVLRHSVLGMAISRYPYESLPFLKLVRAIASYQEISGEDGSPMVITWLGTLRSLTYELPGDFRDYETMQEEDNTNTIRSTFPIPLFQPRSNRLIAYGRKAQSEGEALGSEEFIMPVNTTGRIISDAGPKIAVWWHEISGLKYLGKLLETALMSGDFFDATTGQQVDRDSSIEIVGIMATLLRASHSLECRNNGRLEPQGPTLRILEEASDGLSRNRDIVTVIFGIFEEELQRQSDGSADQSPDLLVVCVQFMHALVPVLPGRVWPLLARSGLLGVAGRSSGLTTVLTAVELVASRYDFLISCIHLLSALIEDAAENAVTRKTKSHDTDRFSTSADPGTGVPNHVLSSVLLSFTRAISEAFVAGCNWKYVNQDQRLLISALSSSVLDKILHYTYCIDDLAAPEEKLTSAFASAAKHIITSFLSTSSGLLHFQPILRGLLDGLSTPDASSLAYASDLWRSHVKAVLKFATTLIRLSALTDTNSTQLESQLFKSSPLLVRLYAVHEAYQDPVIALLNALVISAATGESEPPSLLGHLGTQTSKNFLQMLSDLGKPLDDDVHTISIWRLLASVVSNRQQWFAIYLLTGRTPRASLEKKDQGKTTGAPNKPLLSVALAALTRIDEISSPRVIAILEFVSLSQNYWPWAMGDLLQRDSKFINAIAVFVSKIEPPTASAKMEQLVRAGYQARIAALIAEILAMYLYHIRQLGNSTKEANLVLTHIKFYTLSAVSVPSYNSSLHGNLKRNFEAKFPGCTLQNFKRTDLAVRERGRGFYYDLSLANLMLSTNKAWTGTKNNGLGEELVAANVNLTLVEAQVSVLNGWKMLVTELSNHDLSKKQEEVEGLHRVVAIAASDCLTSNNRVQLPENVFAQLSQTRADLALILIQRLVESRSRIPETLLLLNKAWETMCLLDTAFESALSSSDPRSALYYRTILKIIFLSLRPHVTVPEDGADSRPPSDSLSGRPGNKPVVVTARSGLVLDIINRLVFHGFRDVARAIHELPDTSLPEDIALLTGILQASLNIPGIEFCHEQVLFSMTASDVARVATTLFSWSDKLAIEGDPIYGELSLLFLLELSSVPTIAEQLALDGVLGQIAGASITGYLRRSNISAFADGTGPQRCYSIWVRGILPLLLNILDAVGDPIAAEIAIFLNQFPNLLNNSQSLIDTPGSSSTASMTERKTKYICLSTIQELSCLGLISFVLGRYRESMRGVMEVPAVKWDASEVRESVEWWLSSRAVLRDRIVPLGPRDVIWAKAGALDKSTDSRSRLEELVVGELMGIKDVLNGGES